MASAQFNERQNMKYRLSRKDQKIRAFVLKYARPKMVFASLSKTPVDVNKLPDHRPPSVTITDKDYLTARLISDDEIELDLKHGRD